MKQTIKAAIVYKAEIPTDITVLHNHLAEVSFVPPLSTELISRGFVPVNEEAGCTLASAFPGGVAFRVRIDAKIVPPSVIRDDVAKAIKAIEQTEGRKPGRKERHQIKEGVMVDLAQRALVRTTASVTCYYHEASGYLIVPTTRKSIADVCTTLLVKAVGSVKTETINVSDVKHGLTTRLKQYLDDEECGSFGDFHPCEEVALQDAMKRKVNVKMGYLPQAREGLKEAMNQGFTVTSMGFHHIYGVDFRLTKDFRLRSIQFPPVSADEDEDANTWESEAAIQVESIVEIVEDLTSLLSYKVPAQKAHDEYRDICLTN